ncbi:MAG: DUF2480 family protein, partial [Bacteroidota bacterium]
MEPIVNKVAESGLITLDPVQFLPDPESIKTFDLKNYLFRELILKEKDFRAALKETDWSVYDQKHVAVFCSVDAIIPAWAYMLVASYLIAATTVFFGTKEQLTDAIIAENIKDFDINPYKDQRVVIKGCGDIFVPHAAYMYLTQKLQPLVKSIMYGEPCSTVP